MKPVKNVLIACTGSVATIKLPMLVEALQCRDFPFETKIKVILTQSAKHFCDGNGMPADVEVVDDQMEWSSWQDRGDPVLHIELCKWADVMVIAPLSANSLAKMSAGICDNLLLCIVRAWDFKKPLFFCPAMNTRMYEHPITAGQIKLLRSWGYMEIECIAKTLMCGDTGKGGMAEVSDIVERVMRYLETRNT